MKEQEYVIVIDPGHGGANLGADYDGFLEKEMNLVVAKAMAEELKKYEGIQVYLTREDDQELSLLERAEFAKEVEADFLFCLHFNMSPNNSLYGSEVWIPSAGELNGQAYQFAMIQMESMEEMGLFLRGVKTKLNSRGTDYYGIIRHSTEFGIPSALIEHCHVDEARDVSFCDTIEKLEALGRQDALSVAKYFGLSSQELGVDYSDYPKRVITQGQLYMQPDETTPDLCYAYVDQADYEKNQVTLTLTGYDEDTPMLYYSYSLDGGNTYSPLFSWPGTNLLTGECADSFQFTIDIPGGTIPTIVVRGYNQYDQYKESNLLTSFSVFPKTEISEEEPQESVTESVEESMSIPSVEAESTVDAWNFWKEPVPEEGKGNHFFSFVVLSLLFCILLFFCVALFKQLHRGRKRKSRRNKDR